MLQLLYRNLFRKLYIQKSFQKNILKFYSLSPIHQDKQKCIELTIVDRDGIIHEVKGRKGDSILDVAHENDIDLEGACDSALACSTCHVYIDEEEYFDKLPSPVEDEEDMLDLAPFLKENSRLGCQIKLKEELNGIKVTIPSGTRNFYVDGHRPQTH
ncbi:hypothetical protein SNEBB_010025 [Seison nebaliae]|nr:hypothetical protein SNEBB_010025 [Seison nebaliae]